MIFAGLALPQLLAIFGAAGALTVVFYILKLRRRAVTTPFIKLWERVVKEKEATSLFSKLRRLLSLLLQLALLALLVFALGDPRSSASLTAGRTLVALVDASASMQATDTAPQYKTRLDAAKAEVQKMVRGLGASDRMLVAQMDATVTALGPMTGDTAELDRAVDKLAPTDARADFPRALRFALDALTGTENPEIIVLSDGVLGNAKDAQGKVKIEGAALTYVPIGKESRNVGITQFSVRRYPLDKGRYEVMLEITNTGSQPEDVELSLFGDDVLVDVSKFRLKPNEQLPRFYPSLSGASRKLEARIAPIGESKDYLPADDKAFALLPERKRAKILVVTSGNTYLEAALLLDEYLDVTVVSPKVYAEKYALSAVANFDAAIFDRVTPVTTPPVHALYIDPSAEAGSPVKVGAPTSDPGFDKIDRKSPLVRWTALDDVHIASGHKLTPELGDKVVGASDLSGPLLISGVRAGKKFVALGFDVRNSDLPLRVAWPLLLLNTINFFVDEESQYLSSFRTGEVWRVQLGREHSRATLTTPGGFKDVVPVHEGRAVYLGRRAGVYELRADTKPGDPEVAVQFAANLLDTNESTIETAKELAIEGKKAGVMSGFHVGVRREIWIYLLLLALLLTALEWGTYHRRVTV